MWLVLQQIVVRWRGAFPETAPTAVEMGRRAFESGEDRWFAERWLYDHATAPHSGPELRTLSGELAGAEAAEAMGLQFDVGLTELAVRHLPNEQGHEASERALLTLRPGQWGGWIIDGRVGYFGSHYFSRHFVNIAWLREPAPRTFLERAPSVREDFRFLDAAR